MAKQKKEILNEKEKKEIISDVKKAFNKAQNKIKDNNNPSKTTILLTVLIVLIISIFGIFWFINNNPKIIFLKSVDNIFNNIKSAGVIEITNENNNIYSFVPNGQKNYIKEKGIEPKYIEFAKSIDYTTDSNDVKNILEGKKEAIKKSIEGQKILKTKENHKVIKTTLELDSENVKTILDKIETNLNQNQNFIQSCSNLYNIKEDSVKSGTTKYIQYFKTQYQDADKVIINIYTKEKNKEFIKLEIIKEKDNEGTSLAITFPKKITSN